MAENKLADMSSEIHPGGWDKSPAEMKSSLRSDEIAAFSVPLLDKSAKICYIFSIDITE